MARRRALALLTSAALAVGVGLPVLVSAPSASAATSTVTIAGSLQNELGCPDDWQPGCAATHLDQVGGTTTWKKTFEVPAGSYEFKVAINDAWTENYGVGGVKDGANQPLVLQGPASLEFSYDDTSHVFGVRATQLSGGATPADRALATRSLREALTRERYYFVMTDRFANGDTANDKGGLTGDRLATGLDPTDSGFYHGGDLKGLTGKLDYIKGLGTTSIWLTPSFKNKAVQGAAGQESAGYHGYWITDFTQIDPHLGTNADLKNLIAKAHAKGMKVFFDIITNHTADVISYKEGTNDYRNKTAYPYKDAAGKAFDDKDYAEKPDFPALDPATSFPYTPVVSAAEKDVKVPAWLNDVTMYHNRGDSTFAGESSEYGDFVGLDDLFTERLDVEKGMEDIYKAWVEFGVDGFRIDTVKHVNTEFWQRFGPAMVDHAKAIGNEDFFMFGEVYDAQPSSMSQFTTKGRLQATLDFGFQAQGVGFAQGKGTTGIRDLFADDDYYTDTDSNAYELPTFLGNHDMGRAAMMLKGSSSGDADLMARVKLANTLMYLTRGQPITYYGDEQGFIGSGGDKDARQDMFATRVPKYAGEPVLGGESGAKDRYDTRAPLYRQVKELSALRAQHPALADGAQIHRYASDKAGIYAFSRIDRRTGREYVVALNNASTPASATFQTFNAGERFSPVYGTRRDLYSGKDTRVTVTIPAMGASVWVSGSAVDTGNAAPAVYLPTPANGATVGGRAEIRASVPENRFAEVSFLVRPLGTTQWTPIGTDDNAPYRVFHDVSAMPKGTMLEYRAIARDWEGKVSAVSSAAIVGAPKAAGGGGGGVGGANDPVTQPANVSVPGSHNSEMGCPDLGDGNAGDWAPGCDAAQLILDPKSQIWHSKVGGYQFAAGDYSYKAAINKTWDENYGAGGVKGGSNVDYTNTGTVSFYYDHATHWVTSDAQGPILTAPGSFQSELGCDDWTPSCMRPWLQDPDGDGTYTWSSTKIPVGNYEFKVAHGLSWDENYGAGGVANGPNVALSVPAEGVVVTISYVLATHAISVTTSRAGAAPDLTSAKAFWVEPGLLAWPADGLPAGSDPRQLAWRLGWSATGGLAVDAEALTGGSVADLTYDPAGLPAAVTTAHPELKGYLALRLGRATARNAGAILEGQVAVSLHDDLGRLLDATGIQTAYVLDSLYAKDARRLRYGPDFSDRRPVVRVWAPTAAKVDLLVWPASAPADAPVSSATRVRMTSGVGGHWWAQGSTAAWRNARYLFEVTVFVPSTGKVETNLVTDPYSTGLTLNSTKSVMVDLADSAWKPAQWRSAAAPRLGSAVDQSIYELHIRDFSVGDRTVTATNRGSYLAFTENGDGTKHLKALAAAGLNTVHLLPSFDIASIEEDESAQKTPPCDLASYPADSEEQQACIAKIADADGYNWGYDPWHFMTPEGSYASSAANADGGARTREFRSMVGALHADGLRVVLDQVFNHTAASGLADKSVFDKIVPGYYHRLNKTGAVETSTCCQNIATEHAMAEKLMVDAVVLLARDYKVDGFRFDLMGHHSRDNMLAIRSALNRLSLRSDGVDGKAVTLYGEGWNFGEVADNARFTQATQGQLGGTHIGTFSDRLRDAVRGGGPFDEDPRKQGFGSGLLTDPNASGANGGSAEQKATLDNLTDLTQLGLAGNLRDFPFRSATGEPTTGTEVSYNGSPAGYADQPDEVVSYVDAHDNETLFDALAYKLPVTTPMADRVRMNTVSLATVALSQGISFWHAGTDLLRSKSLDRDSYNSGDWFNVLDWSMQTNGFGRGLPPKASNEAKWSYMRPLLANAALKPSSSDIATASAQAQDLLRLRYSTRLFRLGDADAIRAKVSFPASGTSDAHEGVIAMRIDDTAGRNVDPALKGLVVVFNATPSQVTQRIPGLAGTTLVLSPVQAAGSDAVVRTSSWDVGSGSLTVPARTVAVFVQR